MAEALDHFFKFKNPLLEGLDKQIFSIAVKAADNNGLDRIPETWKQKLIPIVDAAIGKNLDEVRRITVEELLNTKLGDELEYLVYDSFAAFVAAAISFYVDKKNEAPKEKVKK